ncbi:3974_t:CDS:1, partial [Cetraspora pellucida]
TQNRKIDKSILFLLLKMPKSSKQKSHLMYARTQKDKIQQIYKIIPQIDSKSLPQTHKILTNIVTHEKEKEIFQTIREMPESQKRNALKLTEIMRNPKGKHKNEIISVYQQKKALEFITDTSNRKNHIEFLKTKIASLKSVNRKLSKSNQNLIHKIQSVSSLNRHLKNKVEK